MKKILIPISLSILALIVVFAYQSRQFSDKTLRIIFCDVGQGDGILIRTPTGADIVIDGGPNNGKMLACLSQHMPFWDREIELMFATHPDADHIGGLLSVIQSYRVISFNTVSVGSTTATYKNLRDEIRRQGIPYREIVVGDKVSLSDGVQLTTLWPVASFSATTTNEYSLVQVLSFGDFRALLTGDVSFQILNTLDFPESYHIFKLPHHGSKTGVDDVSFDKIRAYMGIISAGKNNRYHHPHPSVISLLKKYSIPYKRTDELGSIEIVTDGVNTRVIN